MDNVIVALVYMSIIFGSISFVMSIALLIKLKDLDNRVWMDGIKNESNISFFLDKNSPPISYFHSFSHLHYLSKNSFSFQLSHSKIQT